MPTYKGRRNIRSVAVVTACFAITACTSGAPPKPSPLPADQVGRPVLAGASEAQSLQAGIMALVDTSMQRIGAGLAISRTDRTPEMRREDANARLLLASAL